MTFPAPTRVDFPVSYGDGSASVAARCLPPDPQRAAALPAPIWLFCSPGAGADWEYWHSEIEGYPGGDYNAARFFAGRGFGVVAIDTIGTGDSDFRGHASGLTLDAIAQAHHEATVGVRERLAAGTLVPGLEPIDEVVLGGLGFSAGGGLTIMQQGAHSSFDLIADVGLNIGPLAGYEQPDQAVEDITVDDRGRYVFPPSRTRRRAQPNYLDDVPDDVMAGKKAPVEFPPSFPALIDGVTLVPYARVTTCPVFLGFGEVDLAQDPIGESKYFEQSDDVTVYVQPGSGHYHNFSGRRVELWTVLANWFESRTRLAVAARARLVADAVA